MKVTRTSHGGSDVAERESRFSEALGCETSKVWDRIFRIAFRAARQFFSPGQLSDQDCEDVAAVTVAYYLESEAPSLRQPLSLATLVRKKAIQVGFDLIRASSRRPEDPDDNLEARPAPRPVQAPEFERERIAHRAYTQTRRLTVKRRKVLRAFLHACLEPGAGPGSTRVSRMLGLPEGTVDSEINRAKKDLRKLCDDDLRRAGQDLTLDDYQWVLVRLLAWMDDDEDLR